LRAPLRAQPSSGRALVWGACGFIGRHLVSHLLSLGVDVSVLTRSRSLYAEPAWGSRVRWFELDGTGAGSGVLREAIASAPVIFDLAGQSGAVASNLDPLASLDHNCREQLELLEACSQIGHRPHVVFASTRLVYGEAQTTAVAEDHPLAPASAYAAHKLCMEHHLRIASRRGRLSSTICRISNPFGLTESYRGKSYGVINTFVMRALAGLPLTLYGGGRQLRDYVYIDDLVHGLALCALRPEARNETFNLGSGIGITLYQAAREIQKLAGAPIVLAPWPAEDAAVESGDFVCDIRKAARLIGFSPRYDFRSGLREALGRQFRQGPPPLAGAARPAYPMVLSLS
jgi:UDP-glucose 4-epimerase